ncbi:ABC transporter permease [Planctomonas psychrotolerans]|uniref:ABC transporter permease n=1 Tax=Planctomonas psychrotolerans TaxID=2528712 RepID=UPI001D0D1697|nr:FtsX-like permease family protein [Planctomonas psychrotolerans]
MTIRDVLSASPPGAGIPRRTDSVGKPPGLHGHGPSIVVTAAGTGFGVIVLMMTHVLSQAVEADPVTGPSSTVGVLLTMAAIVFVVIATVVGAIVTTNTFASIVQSRVRTIALMRLLGSSARGLRRSFLREGLLVGAMGSGLGALLGLGSSLVLTRGLIAGGVLPPLPYGFFDGSLLLPVGGVVVATVSAGWAGSRTVLSVTPLQALGASEEMPAEEGRRPVRTGIALVGAAIGTATLVGGIVLGQSQILGVLVALVGGVVSLSGVVFGAHLFVPAILRLVGRMTNRSLPARLASANSSRHPEISTRSFVGILVGVALVATLSVGLATFRGLIIRAADADPTYYEGIDTMFRTTSLVAGGLVGFSILIAAVGLVNDLTMSVRRRRRELGLLRTLGLDVTQVRAMITVEAAQIAFASIILGTLLGIVYGWAGAQSLLGSIRSGGMIAPVVPPTLIAALLVVGTAVTVIAALAPARRATRTTPIEALRDA